VGSECVWDAGTVSAQCSNGLLHEASSLECACGRYAYDRLETAKVYEETFDERFQGVLVMGAVLVWGRVTPRCGGHRYAHKLKGMNLGLRLRAQYALTARLCAPDEMAHHIQALTGRAQSALGFVWLLTMRIKDRSLR
jgi:hypothetical protein